jgi:phosphatidylglycerol:prolipoprotein diacylglycerol transferase
MTLGAFFTALGYIVGALVFYLAAHRKRLATEGMIYVALAGLVGGVLGAKLMEWALVHYRTFAAHPTAMLDPRLGGRTLIGGVIVGWLAVEFAKWRLGIRRSTGDMFALALPAGEAFGRIGCFFNGCCYGVPSSVTWAVYQHGAWRHPTQLYSSAVAVALFAILFALRDKMPREGDLFRLYIVLFGISRFALEFLRERNVAFGGLSVAQWVCLEMSVMFSLTLFISRRRAQATLQQEVSSHAF